MADAEQNTASVADLSFAAARQIRVTIASPGQLRIAHERVYGGGKTVAAPTSRIEWTVCCTT